MKSHSEIQRIKLNAPNSQYKCKCTQVGSSSQVSFGQQVNLDTSIVATNMRLFFLFILFFGGIISNFANSENPDEMAHYETLIRIFTVCLLIFYIPINIFSVMSQ